MERSPGTELAERLRRVWDLSGRSLRALAGEASLSSSSRARAVAGQTFPPWEAVVALCRVVKRDPRPLRPLWEEARRSSPAVAPAQRTAARTPRNDLPSDMADFTGRASEVEQVLRHIADAKAVVIDGMAGVGKTSLAVHAAHRLAKDFPGGRLYIDLHGFTPGFEPVEPAEALRTLLIALDVSTRAIPDGVERLAARWRDELARRRVLCVLDNAGDADQVRPLLPGAGDSAVIVTSRRRFVALAHIPPVSLEILDGDTAKDLFRRAGGPDARYEREPEAVAEVVRLCGNLPLAIRVAAARLRHRPGWTLAVLTDRLRRQTDDFDTACGMSLRQMDALHRKAFRRLALLPGADFDAAVAAAAVDLPADDTAEILEDLVDVHLLDEPDADRFHLHDLVRGFAARTAEAEEPETERRRAEQRVLDHQLARAEAAVGHFPWLTLPGPVPGSPFPDRDAALAWYDREHANLLAAFRLAETIGDDTFTARLPGLLRPYFGRRGGWSEEVRVLESAAAAARRLDDTRLLAEVRLGLGNARYAAGHTD
ncbi:MAG TPA: NB-ARC domain-containing protein, partial [Phytomonospora sp.]